MATDIVARTADELDATRYRWLRTQGHSLESQHGGGKSCYHVIGQVRELKSGSELDEAVDAALEQAAKSEETIKQLMLFYGVTTLEDLALKQATHVSRLQEKLPDMAHFGPIPRVREG